MKKLVLILFCVKLASAMDQPTYLGLPHIAKYKRETRNTYFNQVEQAKTDQGLQQAYDYFCELNKQEIAPGVTFIRACRFEGNHGTRYPEISEFIRRFSNCAVEKAFLAPDKGQEVAHALKAIAANAHDRCYIVYGHRDIPLDQNEYNTRLNEIADIIKKSPLPSIWIDEGI